LKAFCTTLYDSQGNNMPIAHSHSTRKTHQPVGWVIKTISLG